MTLKRRATEALFTSSMEDGRDSSEKGSSREEGLAPSLGPLQTPLNLVNPPPRLVVLDLDKTSSTASPTSYVSPPESLTQRMRFQPLAFVAIAIALGPPGRLRTSAFTLVPTAALKKCSTALSSCSLSMMSLIPGERGSMGPLILGSKSFTRKAIVQEMGFDPVIRTADIDEASIGDRTADPADLVLELGLAKAQALLPTLRAEFERGVLNTTLLLTGDQVVVHDGKILEKPVDEEEVQRNVAGYARSPCQTLGSAVLTDILTGRQVSGVDTAKLYFSEIPKSVVTELCNEGTVLQCAGGLMVEHLLVQPYVTKINGSIDSVMGLSKSLVLKLLGQLKQPS
ncbi:unnamed protein product [Pylaiella littoralis]